MRSVQDYLDLITSEHKGQPDFEGVVSLSTELHVQIENLIDSLVSSLDIDTSPRGIFLDIIGQWVGVSRIVKNPFSGIFFAFDDVTSNGWDFGIWQSPDSPSAIVVLPDDIYLTLIRAKIAANHWDGTNTGAYSVWRILFPNLNLLINDHQNMSMDVGVQGSVPDSLTLALLVGGYLPLKPEGVHITVYFVPVDNNAFFGFDCETAYVKGFDEGSWARELAPTG